jgi:hypothetical protein
MTDEQLALYKKTFLTILKDDCWYVNCADCPMNYFEDNGFIEYACSDVDCCRIRLIKNLNMLIDHGIITEEEAFMESI